MSYDSARVPADRDWISTGQAVTLGALGLPLTVGASALMDHRLVLEIGAVIVAMVYGVYFGFAIKAGGASDLAVEAVFIVVGLTTAVLALERGSVWLAAGLALHGIWDVLHHPDHRVVGTRGVPGW